MIIGEAEADFVKNSRGSQSFEITHPDSGHTTTSESALEPPEPPGNFLRLNFDPPRPPMSQPKTVPQPLFNHGGSPISNGYPHLTLQGQMRYEHPAYEQTHLVEDELHNNWEPTLSGTRRVSASPHRHPSHYSHKEPRSHVQLQGEAEESIYNPLVGATGGAHRLSNHENQNLPIPGLSPTTPERNLRAHYGDLRMQPDPAHEPAQGSLQHQKPLPVWKVEDALKWKHAKKDPKNYERIRIPDDKENLEKLKGRDHVFLIDNASSMTPYWSKARELLGLLSYLVKRADPDGVDLHFTSSSKNYYQIKSTTKVLEIFDQNKPRSQGLCDMSSGLSLIVNKYQKTLTKMHAPRSIFGKIRSQETRPLSIYTFTDGFWQPKCDVAHVIRSLVKTLNEENLLKQQAGIEFIRFGNSQDGKKWLNDLDNLMLSHSVDMDIVDTEPADGNVLKMLLGSIMPWYDDEPPMNELPTSPSSSSPPRKHHSSEPRDSLNLSVAACVSAVCSAYRDGADILQSIRAKEKVRGGAGQGVFEYPTTTQELELSLNRGEAVVRSQYERDYKHFGGVFANGDEIAIDALKDIIIVLQGQLIANLKKGTYDDFIAMQDVSDSSQDKAILILMQLQQRILHKGELEDVVKLPLYPACYPENRVLPDKLSSTSNLALKYRNQGRWNEAEEMQIGVLDGKQEESGVEHANTFPNGYKQNSVLQYQGKYKEAELKDPQDLRIRDVNPAKNETVGDGYSDDDSELSDLASVQSLQSEGNSSSTSIQNQHFSEIVEHLADLLLEDIVLKPMYEDAIAKFGRERFHKHHDQLLKTFFKDIRSETQNTVQLSAVRSLRSRDRRHKITLLIQTASEPSNVYKQQAMAILRDQKPDRKQLLDNYLGGNTSMPPLEQDDDSDDEGASSDGSDDSSLGQDDGEKYPYLKPLETFFTKSNAFAHLKANLGFLLRPPVNLSEALKSRDLRVVQRFLNKNFDTAATSDYAWLRELDEAGYSLSEIAELLLENISDSPWIHFTPRVRTESSLRTNFHIPDCAHQTNLSTEPPSVLYSDQLPSYPFPLRTDVCRLVQELCGIGGVVPFSKDMSTWDGRVTFEEQSSVSVITYATDSAVTPQSRNDLVVRISNVLTNFCTAAAAVQSAGLCCDSFTVLLRKEDCLELRRLDFCHALTMSSNINLALQNKDTEAAIQRCLQSSEYILGELRMPIANTTSGAGLHYCALAAQFLCSAFLSYVQAHVGSIGPFFLDKPLQKMALLGNQCELGDFAIYAGLVELTCFAEMTQQPVFAFSSRATSQEAGLGSRTSRYDVLTSPEDCLDTWGPGYFVHNKAYPSNIHAIAMGGGFVSLVDKENSRFHWAKGQLSESASWATFEMHTPMRVGTGVNVNGNCCLDEAVYRQSSFSALEPLGTHEVFWETQGRQAGVQGGQYLVGTYCQTWRKVPGITLKQRSLEQSDWRLVDFLDQSWGLQVSFCTGVARRVSLRELVLDLFPIFVNPLEENTWQELENVHNIRHAFTQGDLFAWLRILSSDLQRYVLTLVRTILEQLQYTGLDCQKNTLVIAWPQKGDIGRGVKIPCKAETYWAQVIADAPDCATFAYVTPRCLETNHIKCQGNLRTWQNASKMLITEMSPSGLNGQPLDATNANINTLPVAPVTTTAMSRTQWVLEDRKTYHIKKLDSLLRVKVERPSSASNDVAHLVVMTSSIPQGLWKRFLLKGEEKRHHWIRERQALGDQAELVIVRASLFRT